MIIIIIIILSSCTYKCTRGPTTKYLVDGVMWEKTREKLFFYLLLSLYIEACCHNVLSVATLACVRVYACILMCTTHVYLLPADFYYTEIQRRGCVISGEMAILLTQSLPEKNLSEGPSCYSRGNTHEKRECTNWDNRSMTRRDI